MTWSYPPADGASVFRGACVVLGVAVGVVVGDGLGVGDDDGLGLGLGLGDGGGGLAGGLAGGGLGSEDAAGVGDTLPLGELPGLADVAFPWVTDGSGETSRPPLPLVPPGPLGWLELLVPGVLSPVSPANTWMFPRAKTPATVRTTAPATARAGRSQATARPAGSRSGAPALRDRFGEARVARLPRTCSDRSCPPLSAAPAPAVTSSASAAAAEPDRIVLNQD